ncbi:serine hydrolase [Anaerosalibacter sp. Marseille-P3206]|uniref:serine hydrolase n=1 Tax=Anaerosalibacter sp. Marseille-P3206 TaxID=1871005 RepID=UPI000986AF0A|nr:serine hydrolase [Anaerosalibacter sp. Marseille-P3206]
MFKKLVSVILTFSLVLGMFTITFGDSQMKPIVVLNDTRISLEDETYINEKGLIMCPLRELAEKMGYLVTWNCSDRNITLSKDSEIVKLKVGEHRITVNKENIDISSSPIIKEGKTYVPVELFSKALNLVIGWDNKQQVLKINQPKENKEDFFTMSMDEKLQDELDTYMKALQKHHNFHGSVLVAKDGKVLLNKGYGFANFEQNTLNKSQTKFAIGSMTKQVTAMAIMQLNEQGLIDVEDTVSKYLPDFPNGDLITLHNLLTHTSGLKNYTEIKEFLTLKPESKDPMIVIDLIKDMPLEFEPGKEFRYCNTNYTLLGIIIEKATNMSFEDYLQKNIFAPLNMSSTGICYGKNNELYDATPYLGYLEVVPVDDELVLTQAYGAGNIYSTVEDLYRWDRGLKTEQLVKKETLDKIFTEHVAVSEGGSYGYGWMIAHTDKGKQILHGGNTFGFTSNIAKYIDEDLTIIILTNNGYYNISSLTETLANIVFKKDYKIPEAKKEIKIDNTELYDSYEGKYEFLNGAYIDIIKKDKKLFAQVTGQDAFEIFPETNNKFFAKVIDASIEFKTNDKGEVTELIFEQIGMEFICKRVEDIEEQIEVTVDPKIYEEYVGEYELIPGLIITITTEDNHIYAQLTGQDAFEIFPMSESDYFYKIVDAKITFERDENGKVANLVLHQNGQDMPAIKVK